MTRMQTADGAVERIIDERLAAGERPEGLSAVSTRILGRTMRDAVRNKVLWERRRMPTQDPSTDMAAQSRSQGKLLERLLAFLKVGVVTELQTLQELFPGIATATLGAALQRFRGGASKSPKTPNPPTLKPPRLCLCTAHS